MFLRLTKVVRFVAGSLDLGYLCDASGPPAKTPGRRTRRVARTSLTSDSSVTVEWEQVGADDPTVVDQGTQTEVAEEPELTDVAIQTESASKPFSSIRKDLPQFSRPAKHFVK